MLEATSLKDEEKSDMSRPDRFDKKTGQQMPWYVEMKDTEKQRKKQSFGLASYRIGCRSSGDWSALASTSTTEQAS